MKVQVWTDARSGEAWLMCIGYEDEPIATYGPLQDSEWRGENNKLDLERIDRFINDYLVPEDWSRDVDWIWGRGWHVHYNSRGYDTLGVMADIGYLASLTRALEAAEITEDEE